ncbi:hypothetical protein AV540_19825 [Brevibacillus parabrevis]|uniref:alpha/beta hydrolase n=1 Tax=Brevibacillus parabrevis TaxID=54914 RepID=UPI0007AB6589|nr:alpha/beta hydrolase [Brevibacillus parabrevis]KZE47350.1 hypothetical protein AV540_19825 [Brevibacillus parabrevis]
MVANELFEKRIVTMPSQDSTHDGQVQTNLVYKTSDHGDLNMDIYYPAGYERHKHNPLPAVLLIHGDGPWSFLQTIKDSGQYVSWGQLLAANGLIAVTFTHRSTQRFSKLDDAVQDVKDALAYIREQAGQLGIASGQLGVWVCSAGGPVGLTTALRDETGDIRCIAALYTIMDLQSGCEAHPEWDSAMLRAASATAALEEKAAADIPPLLVAKAGADRADLNASIDAFVQMASRHNVALDYYIHPNGRHAFDLWDDNARTRQIISRIIEFFRTHLTGS